jgi:hypothetical protein
METSKYGQEFEPTNSKRILTMPMSSNYFGFWNGLKLATVGSIICRVCWHEPYAWRYWSKWHVGCHAPNWIARCMLWIILYCSILLHIAYWKISLMLLTCKPPSRKISLKQQFFSFFYFFSILLQVSTYMAIITRSKLRGLSSRTNYIDRATAVCRWS